MPPTSRNNKKATLARSFAALREERGLTLMQVAKSCDIVATTVLKVEAGRGVRWETLHLILSVGLDVLPGSEKYETFHRLWLMHRAEMAESQTTGHSAKKLSKHAAAAIKKIRALIRDLDEAGVQQVLEAVISATDLNGRFNQEPIKLKATTVTTRGKSISKPKL